MLRACVHVLAALRKLRLEDAPYFGQLCEACTEGRPLCLEPPDLLLQVLVLARHGIALSLPRLQEAIFGAQLSAKLLKPLLAPCLVLF